MSGLPSGYTQLEYIQSSGTQYIITNYSPKQNTRMEARFKSSANGQWISGAVESNGQYGYGVYTNGTVFGTSSWIGSMNLYDGSWHDIVFENGSLYSDGVLKLSGTSSDFQTLRPVYIFAVNFGGNVDGRVSPGLALASLKYIENNVAAHDFIPCKNASGAVGLYDTVGAKFYANAGTGTFTAGPEIIPDPPAAPTGLQTVLAVVLQWAASANADRYDVYRDSAKLGSTETTQYVDTTAEPNETYVYTVKAVNGGGESAGTSITVYTKSGYFEYKPLIESANFP